MTDSEKRCIHTSIPSSLEEETQHTKMIPEKILLNQGSNKIHYIRSFRYLRAIIADDLTEDAEIEVQFKKHGLKWGCNATYSKVKTLTEE